MLYRGADRHISEESFLYKKHLLKSKCLIILDNLYCRIDGYRVAGLSWFIKKQYAY